MLDIPAKPESAAHFLEFSKGPDEEGAITGEISASNRRQGTWSMQKS